MAIPEVKGQDILNALAFIDENGVPDRNKSTKYDLVAEDGRRYPPKYVIAVAAHLANGTDISVEGYDAVEARNFLKGKGFAIEAKQERYELTITADTVISTDERFAMGNLGLGDNYKPLDAYFQRADGDIVRRNYGKGERRNCNQTMPRIACQVFESQIAALSAEERENFPVCQYTADGGIYRGVFSSVPEFKKHRNTIEYLTYSCGDGRQFVIYCWNIFSTIVFVKECLKRFGRAGDRFVLTYREKDEREIGQSENEAAITEELTQQFKGYRNPYSSMLIESKNIIFCGAPGTGKSYLAREIAADIISNGYFDDYTLLSEEQKKQVEFVQFHPSYDYSDFVEGLRPKVNDDGSIGFELQDGIFKKFVARARKNCEDSQKSKEIIEKEMSVQEVIANFFSNIDFGTDKFKTINGNEFFITGVDDKHINISIPGNASANKLNLNIDEIRKMLESGERFEKIKDVTNFFEKQFATQGHSYDFAIYKAIKARKTAPLKATAKREELKKYVFIIDEINRGEISKIFGELFFAIDPGYRGRAGEISTQYANLHSDPDEKFFVPENVYIIGTMNDIDRSVDSFDFAMRRRFRFVKLKADERLEMLASLGNEELEAEAIRRMTALNREIVNIEDLNENYQVGASYFLKLKTLSFDQLWTDYLQPLLQDYIQGMYDEEGIMGRLAKAYGYKRLGEGSSDEATQN
ncbi:AAA family ATPase [Bittarella massiliensis (ex Durand et al. 2017)]|uniref:AAA family ATPase n=1 Tax=Bittarella massiliensis (ex Durand et al. 2017) TaxID=1720313 RepID=A0AAW5KAN7_9FIRM|nr:AAA family ATPase [Bittarella massiliensis (ex Durand et al. 2017)]MCQ4950001.1 AAA family ATPase [Bittarella massiliensis (ex Durand et al. 2017)]